MIRGCYFHIGIGAYCTYIKTWAYAKGGGQSPHPLKSIFGRISEKSRIPQKIEDTAKNRGHGRKFGWKIREIYKIHRNFLQKWTKIEDNQQNFRQKNEKSKKNSEISKIFGKNHQKSKKYPRFLTIFTKNVLKFWPKFGLLSPKLENLKSCIRPCI